MHTSFWVGFVIGLLVAFLGPVGVAKLKSLITKA